MTTRRNFFRNTALALGATAISPVMAKPHANPSTGPAPKTLNLGMAGYTFVHFKIDESIHIMKRVGINHVTLKDFHLPYNSSQEDINQVIQQFKQAGIQVYGVGVVYMKTQAEVDRTFDYAKKAGVEMIVGVPTYELLPYTEQKAKEYDLKVAIHNHGPEDKLYPGPRDIYDRIHHMDARMGICLDIGHAFRAGADPARAILDYRTRIFDLHIKDVTAPQKDAKVIEVGRGAINFQALVKALMKINYAGKCSFEYEKDMKDPLPGIAESAGFFRGVVDTLGNTTA